MNINTKHVVGFYTFYQVFQEHRGSDQPIISKKIRQLAKNLEKEINLFVKDRDYRFKIFFDEVHKEQATLNHFEDVLRRHPEISVVCQVPNYFPKSDLPSTLDKLICFDSFRILPEDFNKYWFRTPLSSGPKDEMVLTKDNLESYNLSYLILSEDPLEFSIKKDPNIKSLQAEKESQGFDIKYIPEWRANGFSEIKSYFSNLKPKDVIFIDKESFVNQNQTVQEKLRNRSELLKIYSSSDSKGSICAFRLDTRTLSSIFENRCGTLPQILNFVGEDYFKKLDLQERILSLDSKDSTIAIEQYLSWYYQIILDKVQMVASICEETIPSFDSKDEFVLRLSDALASLDGKNDLFVGSGEVFSFESNKKVSDANYLTSYTQNSKGEIDQRLFPKQHLMKVQGSEEVLVSYPNFDFIRISNISIETGLFECDFFLELTTPFEEGIEILRFNNLHEDNIVVQTVIKEKVNSSYWYYRYQVNGTFRFFPSSENYPFDKQVVFMSYSVVEDNYGILQPIYIHQVDKEFNSDGWRKLGFRSGIIRKKYKHTPVFKDSYFVINEDNRLGIILSRPSSFAIIKVIIPLIFLLSLVVYSFYLSLDKLEITIALLTTSFLSAIALYFSTERPKPLVITTIDLIFMFFYLFVGIGSVAIFVFSLFPEYFDLGLRIYRWVSLGLFVAGIYWIIKRITARKYAPKMVFDDKQ